MRRLHACVEDGVIELVAVSAPNVEIRSGSEELLWPHDDGPFEEARRAAVYLDEEALAEEGFEQGLCFVCAVGSKTVICHAIEIPDNPIAIQDGPFPL